MKISKADMQYGIEKSHEELMTNYLYLKRNGLDDLTHESLVFYSLTSDEKKWTQKYLDKLDNKSISQIDEYYNTKLDKIMSAKKFDAEAYNKNIDSLNKLHRLARNLVLDILDREPYLLLLQDGMNPDAKTSYSATYSLLHKQGEESKIMNYDRKGNEVTYYGLAERDKFKFIALKYNRMIKDIDKRYQKGLISFEDAKEEIQMLNYCFFESNGIDQNRNRVLADIIIKDNLIPEISIDYDIEKVIYNYSNEDTEKMIKKRKVKQKVLKPFKRI